MLVDTLHMHACNASLLDLAKNHLTVVAQAEAVTDNFGMMHLRSLTP